MTYVLTTCLEPSKNNICQRKNDYKTENKFKSGC